MKKTLSLAITLVFFAVNGLLAQNVGIGTNTPDASAKLHIQDANRGLLVPNVALGNVAVAAPVAAPAVGLLVFNTNAAVTGGNGTGFYYWSGTQWLKLITAVSADADFYQVGTTTAPTTINDNVYTLGSTSVGYNNPGTHTLVVANTTPTLKLGNTAGYNNVESGRLTFEENVPVYLVTGGPYCGFEFVHDGNANTLTLNSGCTTTGMIATFTRGTNRMGLKTNAPTADLSVNGTANKTGGGAWAVFSDERLKENITDYNEGLELITKIRPVSFSYNQRMKELWGENESIDGKVYQGVIAQELRKIAPDMVNEVIIDTNTPESDADRTNIENAVDSYLEVDPNKFTYALINAVQEQQEMIENQETTIDSLEQTVEQQQQELDALNARLKKLEELLK